MRVSFTLIIILIFGCTKSDSDFDEEYSDKADAFLHYLSI